MDLAFYVGYGFFCFSAGFSIGFYYLKHKFEDHVTGIVDFDDPSDQLGQILDELEQDDNQ